VSHTATCRECGGTFSAKSYNMDFCGADCRRVFNNRRMTRGAVLYDLLMLEAGNPDMFAKSKMEGRAQNAIKRFLQEDANAGRKRSWKRFEDLQADTLIYATPPLSF